MSTETESLARGASQPPLREDTIGAALDATAREHANREALVIPQEGVRWTWAELRERADEWAAGLLSLGLQPGDRVGIWAPNCSAWALTQFATARAGLILVNINPAYRVAELAYALNKASVSVLVIRSTHLPSRLGDKGPSELSVQLINAIRRKRKNPCFIVLKIGN